METVDVKGKVVDGSVELVVVVVLLLDRRPDKDVVVFRCCRGSSSIDGCLGSDIVVAVVDLFIDIEHFLPAWNT